MAQFDEKKVMDLLDEPLSQRQAFGMIVAQYSEQLYWKIRHLVLTHDDANDILQNTFLKAWQAIDKFHNKSRISTWLYRIAINESLDFLRKQKNLKTADDSEGLANLLMADEFFDGNEAQAVLQEAIATLPEVQRTVFNLRYYDNMKYSSISEILGTSEGSLKASYHIAVKKISEYVLNHFAN